MNAALRRVRVRMPRATAQRGFTLIELLVALVISLLIALAGVAALIASRQGFSGVEAASQLRDNSRFATELIQRVVVQAGFQPVASGAMTRKDAVEFPPGGPRAGYQRCKQLRRYGRCVPSQRDERTRDATACGAADTSCVNGSDVLIVRYQGTGDASMINCAGAASDTIVTGSADRDWSMFHVQRVPKANRH